MPTLEFRRTRKLFQACYADLAQFDRRHIAREAAIRQRFLDLCQA